MADWTNIANTTLEPDAPLTSATMLALRDNPQAIAEGAAGAPRVVRQALNNIEVGDFVFCRLSVDGAVSASSIFENKNDRSSATMSATALNSGTVRIKFSHAGVSTNSIARLYRNDDLINEWTTGSTTASRQVDLPVEIGDRIILQHATSGDQPDDQSVVTDAVICADASSPIVAA